MNERIRELAIQSGLNAPYGSDHESLRDFDYKKFAELIVRECAQVCNDIDSEYEGEDVLATWCAKAIRDHFGVKE